VATPALPLVLLLLGMLPAAAAGGRGGAAPLGAPAARLEAGQPGAYQPGRSAVLYPDTARKPATAADTARVQPAAVALVPDEDEKVTRKSALYIVAAIAVLTLTTLLLYNVRSR